MLQLRAKGGILGKKWGESITKGFPGSLFKTRTLGFLNDINDQFLLCCPGLSCVFTGESPGVLTNAITSQRAWIKNTSQGEQPCGSEDLPYTPVQPPQWDALDGLDAPDSACR